MTHQWQIKIITGPHAGATIPSGEGRYKIGSDDACDLILSDPDIGGQHVALELNEDGIRLSAIDGAAVRLDGRLIGDETVTVDPFLVITIGNTHFAVGPEGSCPDHIALPEMIDDPQLSGDEGWDEATGEEETENAAEPAVADGKQPRRRRRQRTILSVASMLMLTGAVVMVLGAGNLLRRPAAQTEPQKTLTRQIEETLAELEMTHLELSDTPAGGKMLKGYVENRSRKRLLEDKLHRLNHGHGIELDLRISDLMIHSCNDILGQFNLGLDVVIDAKGTLTLSGFAIDETARDKARETILRDVPGIEKLEDKVITAAQLERELKKSIDEALPDHGLTIGWHEGALEARGALPRGNAKTWLTVKAAFAETYKSRFPIREQFTLIRQKQVTVDPGLAIASVHIGAIRFITLEDGSKVFEGAILPGGQTLTGIKHDYLLLRRGSKVLEYPIGGKR